MMKKSRTDIKVVKSYGFARICRVKHGERKIYTPTLIYDLEENVKEYVQDLPATISFLSNEFNTCSKEISDNVMVLKLTGDVDIERDFQIIVITDGIYITKKSRNFIKRIIDLREKISFETLIYLAFTPIRLIPILVYLGVDLFDYEELKIQAYKGRIFINNDFIDISDLDEIPCKCNVCSNKSLNEMTVEDIINHGINKLKEILLNIKYHLKKGTFREYLEYICSNNTHLMEYLRIIDNDMYNIFERYVGLY